MFALAEKRFTDGSRAQPSSNSTMLNAAYVGRARVRLYLGISGRGGRATLVPKGFALNIVTDALN